MKKYFLLLLLTPAFYVLHASNYYVDAVNGNNANSGLSAGLAFKNIQNAANLTNAGDTVFVMNGTYTSSGTVLNISRSGNAGAAIVYTNYPGHSPKLVASIGTYLIISVVPATAYITINGFEVIGYGVNLSLANDTIPAKTQQTCPVAGSPATSIGPFIIKYNGIGINVGNNSGAGGTHHIVISNNIVHDCTAGGMGFGYCDYITVENNVVYNNSWYTIYGTSGISFGYSYNYDTVTTAYRIIVRNNTCYGNRLYIPWHTTCTLSDGNGIILDIPLPSYNGRILVANNIVYNNGGSGIHSLNMRFIDFIHNTAYLNCATPENQGGSIYAYNGDSVNFYNNILYSRLGKKVQGGKNNTHIFYDYNIYYGSNTLDYVGTHSLIQDPKFVNPSTDPSVADFRLQQGSFAINTGDNTHSYPVDINRIARPLANVVDMGAIESNFSGNLNTPNGTITSKVLGNGGGTGEPGAGGYYGPYDTRTSVANQKSRHAIIYPKTLLMASGIPASATIYNLQFKRGIQSGSTQTIPDNSIINIYVRNEASDNFGAAAFDWNSILPGAANPAVLVYAGEAGPLVGNAGGWKTVTFQLPFNYTGNHLGMYVEYLQKGNVGAAPDVLWVYDNGGSQPLYNTTTYPNQLYANKSASASGTATISDGLTSNSERRPVLTIGYVVNGVLPVTFIQFNAAKKGNAVDVKWALAMEANNNGFFIQRSEDGSNFSNIGFVGSKAPGGNSTATTAYNFFDNNPVIGRPVYYRLIQQDMDGKKSYSTIALVTFKADGPGNSMKIYPNPAKDNFNLAIQVFGAAAIATIRLQSADGKLLLTFTRPVLTGSNNVAVNISKFAPSLYTLVVELSTGEQLRANFIKR